MKTSPMLLGCICGALAAVAFVVACSDDSPGDADAAACDCPAAEPPLTGRITRVRTLTTVGASSSGGQSAICPDDATLLGGGCSQDTTDVPDPQLVLVTAGSYATMNARGPWQCEWRNDNTVARPVIVEAICLVPAQ